VAASTSDAYVSSGVAAAYEAAIDGAGLLAPLPRRLATANGVVSGRNKRDGGGSAKIIDSQIYAASTAPVGDASDGLGVPIDALNRRTIAHDREDALRDWTGSNNITKQPGLAGQGARNSVARSGARENVPSTSNSDMLTLADVVETAQRLWEDGLALLKISHCWEAGGLFSGAITLLESQRDATSAAAWSAEERSLVEEARVELIADLGLALVCSGNLGQAVEVIPLYLDTVNPRLQPPHLVNAYGYALFKLGNYIDAEEAFELGTILEKNNAVIWNNLAAVRMLLDKLHPAAVAMRLAVEAAKESQQATPLTDHHKQVFVENARLLEELASPERTSVPASPEVELFYNPQWRWGV
jgi:Flp pilus assembly protein TadD